jgi:pyrimidine operon attenuation protein/uracil phosphoribosyltransferase
MTSSRSGSDLVKDSLLYKEFLAEREEILRHKWLESERAGHDIGFEKALLDWIVRHRADWRSRRQQAMQQTPQQVPQAQQGAHGQEAPQTSPSEQQTSPSEQQ